MPKIIDTFYAVDFDRCLGNFDAMMLLVNSVAEDMSNIDSKMLIEANKEVKASGRSFSLLQFLQENDPNLDLDTLLTEFNSRSQAIPGILLEPGANELIDYLKSQGHQYCIMTFGDEKWQTTKISAAGLSDSTILVVGHERKSHIISQWQDWVTGNFNIPGDCFKSKTSRLAKEVVLIDDKPNAFLHLPDGARGYLVSCESSLTDLEIELPASVIVVGGLNEIVDLEKRRKISKRK